MMNLVLLFLAFQAPASNEDLVQFIILEGDFHQRLEAVRRLDDSLTVNQVDILCKFLTKVEKQSGDQVLKNDLINVLRAQNRRPEPLVSALLAICADTDHDPVLRDYAVQHLGVSHPNGAEKRAVLSALLRASEETDSSIGGTALLALERMQSGLERQALARAAFAAAREQGASELTRIAAIRVCGRLGHQPALPLTRDLVEKETNTSLRMAAIATLGELGDSQDLPLLLELESGLHGSRLTPAAARAVALIRKSHGTKAGI